MLISPRNYMFSVDQITIYSGYKKDTSLRTAFDTIKFNS